MIFACSALIMTLALAPPRQPPSSPPMLHSRSDPGQMGPLLTTQRAGELTPRASTSPPASDTRAPMRRRRQPVPTAGVSTAVAADGAEPPRRSVARPVRASKRGPCGERGENLESGWEPPAAFPPERRSPPARKSVVGTRRQPPPPLTHQSRTTEKSTSGAEKEADTRLSEGDRGAARVRVAAFAPSSLSNQSTHNGCRHTLTHKRGAMAGMLAVTSPPQRRA